MENEKVYDFITTSYRKDIMRQEETHKEIRPLIEFNMPVGPGGVMTAAAIVTVQ